MDVNHFNSMPISSNSDPLAPTSSPAQPTPPNRSSPDKISAPLSWKQGVAPRRGRARDRGDTERSLTLQVFKAVESERNLKTRASLEKTEETAPLTSRKVKKGMRDSLRSFSLRHLVKNEAAKKEGHSSDEEGDATPVKHNTLTLNNLKLSKELQSLESLGATKAQIQLLADLCHGSVPLQLSHLLAGLHLIVKPADFIEQVAYSLTLSLPLKAEENLLKAVNEWIAIGDEQISSPAIQKGLLKIGQVKTEKNPEDPASDLLREKIAKACLLKTEGQTDSVKETIEVSRPSHRPDFKRESLSPRAKVPFTPSLLEFSSEKEVAKKAKIMASKLHALTAEQLKGIPLEEIASLKSEKSLKQFLQLFDSISYLVVYQFAKADSEAQIRLTSTFVRQMQRSLLKVHNYTAAGAIEAAFSNSLVSKKQESASHSNKTEKMGQASAELFSMRQHYKNLREALKQGDNKIVPYFPLVLKELYAVSSKDIISNIDNQLLLYDKMAQTGKILLQLQDNKRHLPNRSIDSDLADYLQQLNTEEALDRQIEALPSP